MLTVQRLAAVFLLGVILFNYPVLALFDKAATVLGLPLIFAYLFAAWAVVILLLVWIVERGEHTERSERSERRERGGA
jgi:Na+-driven multidrug efflux pump